MRDDLDDEYGSPTYNSFLSIIHTHIYITILLISMNKMNIVYMHRDAATDICLAK